MNPISQHFYTCAIIELTGAGMNLIFENYFAWWLLLGLGVATIIAGIIIGKKSKNESTR